MRILLTNDDGISAHGIYVLCQELSEIAKVTVVAPSYEQSGTAHGITVNKPLRMIKSKMQYADMAWAVEGLTADCVKLGIEHILDELPDLVVSGINHGGNLGTDTIYSGTVSGALEGYINKIPSIAISVVDGKSNFELAAKFVKDVCLWWEREYYRPLMALNINIPGNNQKKSKVTKYVNLESANIPMLLSQGPILVADSIFGCMAK